MKDFKISDELQEAIIDYFADQLTVEQAEHLIKWLEESKEHKTYFHHLGEGWRLTGSLHGKEYDVERALKALRFRIREEDIRSVPGRMLQIRLSRLLRVAAGILLLTSIGVAAYFMLKPDVPDFSEGEFYEAYAPKGARSSIVMPDGTIIWLNADTRVRYDADFGIESRDVFLEGEAFFQVEKNEEMPFRVYTSDISITALGTSFNVKSYKDESFIETTLEEGLLEIESLRPVAGSRQKESFTLEPNQNAVFVKNAPDANAMVLTRENTPSTAEPGRNPVVQDVLPVLKPVEINEVDDTKLYTSWKDSRWIIRNEMLSNLVIKLERRYDVSVIFMNENLKEYAITATLLEEPLEQVLQALSLSTPILFEVKSKNVYLYENPELIRQYEKILNP